MTSEAVNFNKQQFVVAHSETGHHHTVAAKQGVEYYASNDPLICFLVVKNDDVQLRHNRSFDTHIVPSL
jgi:hypothetical protein